MVIFQYIFALSSLIKYLSYFLFTFQAKYLDIKFCINQMFAQSAKDGILYKSKSTLSILLKIILLNIV
mgnify:CR=1 FL=1